FDESYCGYIDCNTLRAGYPESKRCGEALCQAYIRERGLDAVIARFTRSYGPTVLDSDTKAISQFIGRAVMGGDIILKSEGNQYYSYTYAADAVAGLLTVLLEGEKGEAYNIADERSDIRLKELAVLIADHVGTSVKYELPDEVERSGYSTATRARLDGSKIKQLGWTARYDIKQGINRTLDILQSISHK
ncbi:MAG: NAD-dependent epimerase/dehydratase family protein, partial [Lachnospiraceae bacterium]|nr:NAD-dependent epimerase/dehydratase family protein [Lachnospiraceae bacterium]